MKKKIGDLTFQYNIIVLEHFLYGTKLDLFGKTDLVQLHQKESVLRQAQKLSG